MPRKNIAIIVPTLNKGGAERVAANLSAEFSKYYNVYVIVHDGRDITYPYGGILCDLKIPPSNSKIKKIINLIKRIRAVRKIKQRYSIDYTLSHLPPANYVNIFSRKKDKIYTFVHSTEKNTLKNIIRMKTVALLSDKVICVSECIRNNLIHNFKISEKKLVTVYNFCPGLKPGDNYCELEHRKHKQSDTITVVNMGRLSKPKGQWHLIRAFSHVVKKHKNVRLEIIGDGELRDDLKELTKKLNIENHVYFAGFLINPFERLARADIYVSSSLYEGLPMALIEAGMYGIPIISTDCDGCREYVAPNTVEAKNSMNEDKFGILVPAFNEGTISQTELTPNEKILADAIETLISDREKRKHFGIMARQRSLDFIPDKIMKQWFELLT